MSAKSLCTGSVYSCSLDSCRRIFSNKAASLSILLSRGAYGAMVSSNPWDQLLGVARHVYVHVLDVPWEFNFLTERLRSAYLATGRAVIAGWFVCDG